MITEAHRYGSKEGVDLRDAEAALLLSPLAAEGMCGESRVRMNAAYAVDEPLRAIAFDCSTQVGQDVPSIFTAFISREFGPGAFQVQRGGQEGQS